MSRFSSIFRLKKIGSRPGRELYRIVLYRDKKRGACLPLTSVRSIAHICCSAQNLYIFPRNGYGQGEWLSPDIASAS